MCPGGKGTMMKKRNDTIDAGAPSAGGTKKRGRKKKALRRWITVIVILVIAAGAGYMTWLRLKEEYTVTYQSYTASVGTIANSLSFSGSLQAIDNVTYTAPSSTTVRAVYVAKAAEVKEGDKLMRLNNGTVIEAEFDGRVNQLPVAAGDKVASGDTLIQVVDFDHMKVSFRVDEYDIAHVRAGDQVTVTTTASEKTFLSSIDDINYVSSSTGSVAYYTATAYVDTEGDVYPGMQVTVTITREEAADVVILKEDALSFDGRNRAFVYTPGENGAMTETYVETGVSNGNYVEIREGVSAGDTVYAVAKTTGASGLGSLMSTLFGGQRIMNTGTRPGGGQTNRNPGGNWQNRNTDGSGGNR